jgi:hypothetical protein
MVKASLTIFQHYRDNFGSTIGLRNGWDLFRLGGTATSFASGY